MEVKKKNIGNILMLNENSFPGDQRVSLEAFTLRDAGYQVSVIALNKRQEKAYEEIDGVTVYRIRKHDFFAKTAQKSNGPLGKVLAAVTGVLGYIMRYFYFTGGAFFLSLQVWLKKGIDVIHAHNPPDTLFLIGTFYKLFGKKFVFDHHDLAPELYLSRFEKGQKSPIYRMIRWVEKRSLKTADMVISTNESYKKIDIERGERSPESVFVVRNGPNLKRVRLVEPDKNLRDKSEFILGYVGALNPQDGVDYLLRALKILKYDLGRDDFHCAILGKGDSLESLKALAKSLKIDDFMFFPGHCPDDVLFPYLSAADICVGPDPSSPQNDASTFIKLMEYMALSKPIVSFDLPESRVTAEEAALYVPPNDEMAFAKGIEKLMDDPALRKKMGDFGFNRIRNELAWPHVAKNLVAAYGWLFDFGAGQSESERAKVRKAA